MLPNGTPEERLHARLAVHELMLVDLWSRVLDRDPDALEAAEFAQSHALRHLDAVFDEARLGGTVVQALAAERMEKLWKLITTDLGSLDGPTDLGLPPDG